MRFSEKLSRLTEGKNKQKLGKIAGLPVTAVSDYIAKNHIPRADKALKLAKALGVDLSWLIDDSRDWPPPPVAPSGAETLPYAELMREVLRRYRLAAIDFKTALDKAEKIDWLDVLQAIVSLHPGEQLPPDLAAKVRMADEITSHETIIRRWDISYLATIFEGLPGADSPEADDLVMEALLKRAREMKSIHHGLDEVIQATAYLPFDSQDPKWAVEWRRRLAKGIDHARGESSDLRRENNRKII